MKSKIATTAILLFIPFFLTACSLSDLPLIGKKKSQAPVTLTMWGLWENPETMNLLINKYKEKHPNVTVNYDDRSVVKLEDYKETVYTRASQNDAPDIVVVHNSWVKGLKDSLTPASKEAFSSQNFSQRFYNVATTSAVLDDKVYALPLYYDGLVLVYNKKHFEEIDQRDPPTAWEEFRRLALALTIRGESGSIVRSGAAMGTADNIDFFGDILGLMFAQAKVDIPDGLDTKPAQDALTFYRNFAAEDRVWDGNMAEASTAFVSERTSMIFVPSWNLLDILTARPDLSVGIAPVPQAIPNEPVSWGSFWMSTVTSGSKNKDAAWDFIKFLSENDQQMQLFSEASKNRVYGAAYSAKDLKSQLDNNQYLKPVISQAEFAASGRIASRSGNKAATEALRAVFTQLAERGNTKKIDELMVEAKEKITNTK